MASKAMKRGTVDQLWTKEVEEPEVKNSYQYVFELREKLEDTLKLAHSELEKAQQKGKYYYTTASLKLGSFNQVIRCLCCCLPTITSYLWSGKVPLKLVQ